eukprot:4566977-Pyramimonas_sp.AAC.1
MPPPLTPLVRGRSRRFALAMLSVRGTGQAAEISWDQFVDMVREAKAHCDAAMHAGVGARVSPGLQRLQQ